MVGRSHRTAVLLAIALVLGAAACGAEDDGGVIAGEPTTSAPTTTSAGDTTTTTTSGGDAVAAIELTVDRVDLGQSATLSCAGGGGATGTGWLADPAAAADACALVMGDENARRLLIERPDPGRICTEIYGGPEQAEVSGTIDGEPFTARFARTDGCAISDWDHLAPLLGAAGS